MVSHACQKPRGVVTNDLTCANIMSSCTQIKPCDEKVLMHAVSKSPVVIAMDAYCDNFMAYAGGIMTFSCAPPSEHQEVSDGLAPVG